MVVGVKYLSVCSGIEAATVAWHPLGWVPVAFSEIEAFPSAVLDYHYPNTPNWGDMEAFHDWPDADVDVLVGGTPCQSFSVAGLRRGLDDPRGNLALVYLAIAERYRPEWLVWENVPGVLSANEGRAFGAFLGGLEKLGYGWAYRTLDAQYFGLAQRRRRVFVVASTRGWAAAGSVLFEPESLRGDSAPSREAGEGVAPSLAARTRGGGGLGTDTELDGGLIPEVAATVTSGVPNGGAGHGARSGHAKDSTLIPATTHALTQRYDSSEDGCGRGTPLVPAHPVCMATGQSGAEVSQDGAGPTLTCNHEAPIAAIPFDTTQITSKDSRSNPGVGDPSHPLTVFGDAPAIAYAFDARQSDVIQYGNMAGPLDTDGNSQGVAFTQNQRDEVRSMDVAGALAAEPGAKQQTYIRQHMMVRRLTPRECERLQGFKDDYTLIPYRNGWAKDGPRYKALGNSMAVPVIGWIGERIQAFNDKAGGV